MSSFVIDRLVPLADVADLGVELATVRAMAAVLTARGKSMRVLHATYVPARQSCQCVVDADDAETVLEALRLVGAHTAHVLPALNL